jgi:hypothetical protein
MKKIKIKKILQKLINSSKECPSSFGLKDHCGSNPCKKCWKESVKDLDIYETHLKGGK